MSYELLQLFMCTITFHHVCHHHLIYIQSLLAVPPHIQWKYMYVSLFHNNNYCQLLLTIYGRVITINSILANEYTNSAWSIYSLAVAHCRIVTSLCQRNTAVEKPSFG